MQQLTFVKRGILEWHDVPEPTLQMPTDVLVRPIAVARCDLDLGILLGLTPFRGPFPFGHEFVAEITAIGDAVQQFQIGQRVIVPFQISCGKCTRCQKGVSNSCLEVPPVSAYGIGQAARDFGGAFSDVVRVPYAERMLIPIPPNVEPAAIASISDNLSDAWRTIGPYLLENPNQNVLVVGGAARSIGVYTVAIAKALGASEVTYVDTNDESLQLAEAAGATSIEGQPPKRLGPFALTVDASNIPEGLHCALRSTEPGGICTSVSIFFQETTLPLFEMYSTGVTFKTGMVNSRETIPHVLSLVQSGRLQPEKYTTLLTTWPNAPEALFEATNKVVVTR